MSKLRYHARKGWTGQDERALYHVTDNLTGGTQVRRGEDLRAVGPEATIRLATRAEADASGWPQGWTVADHFAPIHDRPAARRTGGKWHVEDTNGRRVGGAMTEGAARRYACEKSAAWEESTFLVAPDGVAEEVRCSERDT